MSKKAGFDSPRQRVPRPTHRVECKYRGCVSKHVGGGLLENVRMYGTGVARRSNTAVRMGLTHRRRAPTKPEALTRQKRAHGRRIGGIPDRCIRTCDLVRAAQAPAAMLFRRVFRVCVYLPCAYSCSSVNFQSPRVAQAQPVNGPGVGLSAPASTSGVCTGMRVAQPTTNTIIRKWCSSRA